MKFKLPNAKFSAKLLSQVIFYLSVGIGVAASLHGVWLLSQPAAYIAGGVLLAVCGFLGALEDKDSEGGWD